MIRFLLLILFTVLNEQARGALTTPFNYSYDANKTKQDTVQHLYE
jgi:hypothetical protein